MRLDDPALVEREYASEDRLARRREAIASYLNGPNAVDVALDAVREVEPARVLEVGCGMGELSERIVHETRAEVVAVDVSARMVELTAARGIEALVGDVQELPFAADEFDCAVAGWMLYHVPDLRLAIAELSRVLRPGGRLVATTLCADNLLELRALLGEKSRPPRPFSGENGAELLRATFGRVESRAVRAALVFPDREAVQRYVAANIVLAPLLDDLPKFEGPFRARTSQVVFVAEDPS